jgi:hypothetical protein
MVSTNLGRRGEVRLLTKDGRVGLLEEKRLYWWIHIESAS